MRIGFICTEDPTNVRSWSGIPYFVYRELLAQASEVLLISPLRRDFRFIYAPLILLGKLLKKRYQVDRHSLALASYAWQITEKSKRCRIDVYVVLSSIPAARLSGTIPVIQWADAVSECMPGYYSGSFSGLSSRELMIAHRQEQSALNRSTYAVYSSEWAASMVLSHYRSRPGQVRVIPFGSNIEDVPLRGELNEIINRRLERKCVLLFVGVDWERKGGHLALEATTLLNKRGIPTTLKVVGCKAPASPFIDNLGYLDKSRLADLAVLLDLYKEATFFIFPTRAEAAGIVFCEAAAFGLPVVSCLTGGVPTYVENGVTGILLPLSAAAKDYADSIEALLMDQTKYRMFSSAARSSYENRLHWKSAVGKLLDLCRMAVANREREK